MDSKNISDVKVLSYPCFPPADDAKTRNRKQEKEIARYYNSVRGAEGIATAKPCSIHPNPRVYVNKQLDDRSGVGEPRGSVTMAGGKLPPCTPEEKLGRHWDVVGTRRLGQNAFYPAKLDKA